MRVYLDFSIPVEVKFPGIKKMKQRKKTYRYVEIETVAEFSNILSYCPNDTMAITKSYDGGLVLEQID